MALVKNKTFKFEGTSIAPGEYQTIDVSIGQLYTHTPINMPVHVINGKYEGPVMFVAAAIHGDELNGIEIIQRLLRLPSLKRIRGTLIAIPIVNVISVVHQSRYLPDRRDLNRSFPGSKRGSLASRMANTFMRKVVAHCDFGIDLHTGAIHRSNLPQIRAQLDNDAMISFAKAFNAPVVLNSKASASTLRGACAKKNIPVITYETGEALRFDELGIRAGVKGIINVMRHIGMMAKLKNPKNPEVILAEESSWVRAPESGILRSNLKLGAKIVKGQQLGTVSSPYEDEVTDVKATIGGILVGKTEIPLVHGGDALFHVAKVGSNTKAVAKIKAFKNRHLKSGEEE